MELVEAIAGDTKTFIKPAAVFVEPPHIPYNHVRCHTDTTILSNDEAFTGIKRRVLHAALGCFNQQEPFPDLTIRHANLDSCVGFGVDERNWFCSRDTFLLPRFRKAILLGRTVGSGVVNIEFP